MQVSAYSLKALAEACRPLMSAGRLGRRADLRRHRRLAGVRLDGRGQGRRSSRRSRYLARDLGPQGIRVNLVSAGPLRDAGRQGDPRLRASSRTIWSDRAPLGWDNADHEPTAKAVCALLSDWFPATTGEIVHVDGGFHATGA